MSYSSFAAFRARLAGSALALSAIAALVSPAFAIDAARQDSKPKAVTSNSATSAGTASQAGTATSGAGASNGKTSASASGDCRHVQRGSSSTITSDANGLSGTTRVPDGSSVTVHSGGGSVSSSSAASASSSGESGQSSIVAGAGSGDDCVITSDPDVATPRNRQRREP